MPTPSLITICDTCGFSAEEKLRDGATGGETFAALVEAAAAGEPRVAVRRHSCLMGCDHPCNAAVSAEGKTSYVLGRFAADSAEAAEALVAYAAEHSDSETGVVPFKRWPQGVKGRFIARLPRVEPQG